jgi:hypothetical protein
MSNDGQNKTTQKEMKTTIKCKCPMCGHENTVWVECSILDVNNNSPIPQIVSCDVESGGCDKYFAIIVKPTITYTTLQFKDYTTPCVNESMGQCVNKIGCDLFYLLLDYINKRLTQIQKDKASDIIVPPNERELRMLSEFLHTWKGLPLKQTDMTNEQI